MMMIMNRKKNHKLWEAKKNKNQKNILNIMVKKYENIYKVIFIFIYKFFNNILNFFTFIQNIKNK